MTSMSTAPIYPLQPHHFSNLIEILRRANEVYKAVAIEIRANLRPSRRARRYARNVLGLQVDVGKAVRCDQKQISVVPLPILDTDYSPIVTVNPGIYLSGNTHELRSISSQLSLRRRPTLKCVIPEVVTRTTPNGTTSTIALPRSTSIYSSVSLSSPLVANGFLGSEVASPRLVSIWSADGEGGALLPSDAPTNVHIDNPVSPSMRAWRPLDVPIDEEEMDWGLEDSFDMDVSSPGSSTSSSVATSGTDSSTGPTTPVDEEPIVIRIKRKSAELFDDGFEKRPKFERREWVQPTTQRKIVIRIPARR
ncbi:hypothetical protein BDZ94DRAFT_1249959 [Collybia nuda]|uniref:Uncharacterized protein n=1 Tax=Collybia nuda TaxID=64659 RepID=A0A9P5YDV6_9AGAR|nr:hypothetical protein BDZ94DRAFT_1249959 [Collybia nuda]